MSDQRMHEQVIAPVVLVVWLEHMDSWPQLAMPGIVFVLFAGMGVLCVGLAVWFHVTRSIWRRHADDDGGVCGATQQTRAVPRDMLSEVIWIDGDADVPSGIRRRTHDGQELFVPSQHEGRHRPSMYGGDSRC